ncbi:von Willebrand factor type A domain protein [Necator americanus]|uniref:von Willebrand factor type A domain protein n=1 Tax=Necator americanus TaxID=51031 RepID=W2TSZ4_NECAM|nr:von Willebrand factor type A domain protein [Necator americanus]ETN84182.1 von Willebrand factor type A domain protein [Necator americanus]
MFKQASTMVLRLEQVRERELFRMEPTGGTTRTGEAIQYAVKEFENKKHGARKNARKFVVVFTDGYSQEGAIPEDLIEEDPSAAAEAARAEGVVMIAVAVDDKLKPNEEELMEITRRRDMVLISPNGKQLREKILGNQCPL